MPNLQMYIEDDTVLYSSWLIMALITELIDTWLLYLITVLVSKSSGEITIQEGLKMMETFRTAHSDFTPMAVSCKCATITIYCAGRATLTGP